MSSIRCQFRVGTCGYSYPEWVKVGFYERPSQMLPEYARHFPVTELNHTWYGMPAPEKIERQRRLAPSGFQFAAKLTRTLTHEVDPGRWRDEVLAYREGVAPLVRAGQLIAVLVQLPNRFRRTRTNRAHLAALLEELDGLPMAVEFRNASWARDSVFYELERRRVALVTVDEPPLPGLFPSLPDVVTHPDLIYVRFHGRNRRGWYSGSKERQFDYNYTDPELEEWVDSRLPRMAQKVRRGYVFFNNHVAAQAPRNAEALTRLLRRQGFRVAGPLS